MSFPKSLRRGRAARARRRAISSSSNPVISLEKHRPHRGRHEPRGSLAAPAGEMLFVPLGGCNQIGMNMSLYGFGGKWILVDAGIAFADPDETPGIEAFMPDPKFIEERMDDILALVVTHAHEDHIGAVHRLWPRLSCPIYATPFAAHVLRGRFAEQRVSDFVTLRTYKPGSRFEIGPFTIESIPMTHSIPEMSALAITTRAGTVLHTGDWKLDPNPLVGPVSDLAALTRLGDAGVLAMVCDSTNADQSGHAGSEADARNGLIEAFAQCSGAVAVACFASNVARLRAVADAAKATGRQVGLSGRSLLRMEQAARACGYLAGVPRFLNEEQIANLPRRERVIVCTGSQGEERSALARIAHGTKPRVRLSAGDTVIFSARCIPGNEEQIAALTSLLRARKIDVITASDRPVHVSGHPGQDDLRRVYGMVKPQILVPVHGTPAHLAAHAAFAESCGVPQTCVPRDGVIIGLSAAGARVIDRFEPGLFAYNGVEIGPWRGPRPRMAGAEHIAGVAPPPAVQDVALVA